MWDDPFGDWDLLDVTKSYHQLYPRSNVNQLAYRVGVDFATAHDFDLGVFGQLNPQGSDLENFIRIADYISQNPDFLGDIPDLLLGDTFEGNPFEGAFDELKNAFGNLGEEVFGDISPDAFADVSLEGIFPTGTAPTDSSQGAAQDLSQDIVDSGLVPSADIPQALPQDESIFSDLSLTTSEPDLSASTLDESNLVADVGMPVEEGADVSSLGGEAVSTETLAVGSDAEIGGSLLSESAGLVEGGEAIDLLALLL